MPFVVVRESYAVYRGRPIRPRAYEGNVPTGRMGEPEEFYSVATGSVTVVTVRDRITEGHDLAGGTVGRAGVIGG